MTQPITDVHLLTFDAKHNNDIVVYAREEDAEQALATHRLEVMHAWGGTLLEGLEGDERAAVQAVIDLPAGPAGGNAALINKAWDDADLSEATNDFSRVEAYRVQA